MGKIAIVGYGNVGFHFADRLSKRNEVSIFSRKAEAPPVQSLEKMTPDEFEFIVLCVSDDSIKEVADSFQSKNTIVVHTSGTRPISDLNNHSKCGVVYPLQTFSRSKKIDSDFPILVECESDAEKSIYELAQTIGNPVKMVSSEQRAKIHLAAVFACNFTNHMFDISNRLLENVNSSFDDLKPLVIETLNKAFEIGPRKAQTGPAIRKDELTIRRHVDMLEDQDLKQLYQLITTNIQRFQ